MGGSGDWWLCLFKYASGSRRVGNEFSPTLTTRPTCDIGNLPFWTWDTIITTKFLPFSLSLLITRVAGFGTDGKWRHLSIEKKSKRGKLRYDVTVKVDAEESRTWCLESSTRVFFNRWLNIPHYLCSQMLVLRRINQGVVLNYM